MSDELNPALNLEAETWKRRVKRAQMKHRGNLKVMEHLAILSHQIKVWSRPIDDYRQRVTLAAATQASIRRLKALGVEL